MKVLVKKVKVLNTKSEYNNQIVDILIDKGIISKIDKNIEINSKEMKIIEGNQLIISNSFIDINCQSGEPYFTEIEDLESLSKAAKEGGISHVYLNSNIQNSFNNKSIVKLLSSNTSNDLIHFNIVGDIIEKEESNNLTNLYEMYSEGVQGFFNGNQSGLNIEIMSNAMNYIKSFDGKMMIFPQINNLSKNGHVNQSINSVISGFKGMPDIAESIAVKQILDISIYNNFSPILMNISCQKSIEIIRSYRDKLDFKVGVSSLHLRFNDEKILDYNTNYKLSPPLRTEFDRKSLINATKEGIIDFVYSQHTPWIEDYKDLEFDKASFGASNIQCSFLNTVLSLGRDNIELIIKLYSTNQQEYFGIDLGTVKENTKGNFVIFDLDTSFEYNKKVDKSLSKNNPSFNTTYSTKVLATIDNFTINYFN